MTKKEEIEGVVRNPRCSRRLPVCVWAHLVVIVEHDELAKTPVASQGCSLVGDTLHVAAISHDGVAAQHAGPMSKQDELQQQAASCTHCLLRASLKHP